MFLSHRKRTERGKSRAIDRKERRTAARRRVARYSHTRRVLCVGAVVADDEHYDRK